MAGKKIVETLQVPQPDKRGSLKPIGGSDNDDFCNVLVNQVCSSLWKKNSDPDERQRQMLAVMTRHDGLAATRRARGHADWAADRQSQRRDGVLPAGNDR